MICTFGEQPPVYAKPRENSATPYPTTCMLFFSIYLSIVSEKFQFYLIKYCPM